MSNACKFLAISLVITVISFLLPIIVPDDEYDSCLERCLAMQTECVYQYEKFVTNVVVPCLNGKLSDVCYKVEKISVVSLKSNPEVKYITGIWPDRTNVSTCYFDKYNPNKAPELSCICLHYMFSIMIVILITLFLINLVLLIVQGYIK